LGGNTKAVAEALAEGIKKGGAKTFLKNATDANAEDFINCDGIVLGSPDYFSYMAGGLKDFFDRTWFHVMGKVTNKPYILFITHGGNGEAIKSLVQMCKRFKLKKAAKPFMIRNKPDSKETEKIIALGYEFALKLESLQPYIFTDNNYKNKYEQFINNISKINKIPKKIRSFIYRFLYKL
jgi:flavorubredoxin